MTAAWWKDTAWPWIKENWWAVLLFPIAIIVFVMMFLARGQKGLVLDPTREADERAKEEAETRARMLAEQKRELAHKVRDLERQVQSQQEHIEQRVAEEVDALRDDPERLRELMLQTGPGSK